MCEVARQLRASNAESLGGELGLLGGQTFGFGGTASSQRFIEASQLLFHGLGRNLGEDRCGLRHHGADLDCLALPRVHVHTELVIAGDDRVREAGLVEILDFLDRKSVV